MCSNIRSCQVLEKSIHLFRELGWVRVMMWEELMEVSRLLKSVGMVATGCRRRICFQGTLVEYFFYYMVDFDRSCSNFLILDGFVVC